MKLVKRVWNFVCYVIGLGSSPKGYIIERNELGGWRWARYDGVCSWSIIQNWNSPSLYTRAGAIRQARRDERERIYARKYCAWTKESNE